MQTILDWSEVWSLLIPLAIIIFGKRQPAVNRPVVIYVVLALLANAAINCIWKFKWITYNHVPYNGFIYNVHSILRFLCFDAYFSRLHRQYPIALARTVRVVFLVFILINFSFFEQFYNPRSPFSSRLFTVEAILLLILCLQYYFYKFSSDEEGRANQPDFFIVTGLSIYVVVNFFIFLLHNKLALYSVAFAVQLWNVHNISYILLNLFLAKALYESQR